MLLWSMCPLVNPIMIYILQDKLCNKTPTNSMFKYY